MIHNTSTVAAPVYAIALSERQREIVEGAIKRANQ
jgi:hypothetical protein